MEYIRKTFTHFIKTGNINRTPRLLYENSDNGVLNLTDEAKQQLNIKHPEASPKFYTILLQDPMNETHEIVFNEITEDLIQKINIRTKRAARPSKFDADDWH